MIIDLNPEQMRALAAENCPVPEQDLSIDEALDYLSRVYDLEFIYADPASRFHSERKADCFADIADCIYA